MHEPKFQINRPALSDTNRYALVKLMNLVLDPYTHMGFERSTGLNQLDKVRHEQVMKAVSKLYNTFYPTGISIVVDGRARKAFDPNRIDDVLDYPFELKLLTERAGAAHLLTPSEAGAISSIPDLVKSRSDLAHAITEATMAATNARV